ncbi:diguanylate cyclase domain-containing protein [Micromonosporaceae bacterium Da 78-11]
MVLHLSGVGGWHFQSVGYRIFEPVLSAVPLWLAWRASRRATSRGARRFSLLMGGAWLCMTLSSTTELIQTVVLHDLTYPSSSAIVKGFDSGILIFVLVSLLTVRVRARFSASRLRLGLDMATVLLAGSVFNWYFVVEPNLEKHGDTLTTVWAFVQVAAVMVVLYAIVRLVLGGVAEVSRGALLFYAAAGVVDVVLSLLQETFAGDESALHYPLAAWALLTGLLMAAEVMQLRSSARTAPARAGQSRRPSSMMPYVAVAATYALLVDALIDGLDARSWAVLGGSIVLTSLVVARQIVAVRDNSRLVVRLDDSVRALRQAMAREQVLGDLGTTLLTTTEPDEVHRLAVAAATALLQECPGSRASIIAVAPDDPESFVVVSAAGAEDHAVLEVGGRLPSSAVPLELLARLADGEVVSGEGLSGLGVTGFDSDAERPLTLLPLLNGERFFGVLSVSAGRDLPPDIFKALQAMRTQISLALDSVALTAELRMRAMHDALTGLGNRALLRERLTCALARAKRSGRPVAALLLDLNGFKPINDTYGHDAGDELLKVVADRLRVSVRTEDLVGRLGGDEFVVIAEDLHDVQDAIVIAERIVDALDESADIDGHRVRTPASIGIALSHDATLTPDDLLREADTAMYAAKRRGGGRYQLHERESALS